MNRSLVLDVGALIGVERRSPRLQELLRHARARTVAIVIPTVVAQVVRSGGRQASRRRFLATRI